MSRRHQTINEEGAARFKGLRGTFYDMRYHKKEQTGILEDKYASISFSQLDDGKEHPDEKHVWFLSNLTQGGDYGGNLVERSNYEALLEQAEGAEAADGRFFAEVHGDHGSYGLILHVTRTPNEIVESLYALEDYPLLDEDLHSKLIMEAENEAWTDRVAKEYAEELGKLFVGNAEGVDSDVFSRHFEKYREKANVYWENEQGDSMYINIEAIAKAAHEANDPPEGFKYDQTEEEDAADSIIENLSIQDIERSNVRSPEAAARITKFLRKTGYALDTDAVIDALDKKIRILRTDLAKKRESAGQTRLPGVEGLEELDPKLDQALQTYINALQTYANEDFAKRYPDSPHMVAPTYEFTEGGRYVKIISNSGPSRSVFAFVDKNTGDIYKPASFKAPAKGVRGSIYKIEKNILTMGGLYR